MSTYSILQIYTERLVTKEVRAQIEELLKDFGGAGETELRIPRPVARDDSRERNRVVGTSGGGDNRVIEMQEPRPGSRQSSAERKQSRGWREQRRWWRQAMAEAGCRLPFPEDREGLRAVLTYVLGRLLARRMRPQSAEAIVHLCKLMMST